MIELRKDLKLMGDLNQSRDGRGQAEITSLFVQRGGGGELTALMYIVLFYSKMVSPHCFPLKMFIHLTQVKKLTFPMELKPKKKRKDTLTDSHPARL